VNNGQLLAPTLAGLGLGLGLIVAIGAQNAFVLRQGIRREHVLPVVLICIGSDAVLIVAGVAGAGALFTAVPWLTSAARWGGALFLFGYAVLAARRALRRPDQDAEGLRVDSNAVGQVSAAGKGAERHCPPTSGQRASDRAGAATLAIDSRTTTAVIVSEPGRLLAVIGTALAFTWLNPHVYLDTFVLLGSVGSSHGQARWAFAAGAILGSTLWFSALGVAARALAPVFARAVAWRVLDGIIAVVMTAVATGLLVGG
jgi:L-lysine exporter family protein LysE/ArgO